MLVEEIDAIGAQALQRGVANRPDMIWPAVEAAPLARLAPRAV
jgi:hypothetical protein